MRARVTPGATVADGFGFSFDRKNVEKNYYYIFLREKYIVYRVDVVYIEDLVNIVYVR